MFDYHLSGDINFKEFSNWYYEVIAPRVQKEHTIYNNRLLIRNYVAPYIGDMALQDITPIVIDDLLFLLMEKGALKRGKTLSDSTVKQIRIAASAIFETAVKKEIICRNPVKFSTKVNTKQKERAFLDTDACRKILFLCDDIPNRQIANAIKLLLYTGLRRGELIGLRWDDIDFSKSELSVRRTVSQFGGKNIVTDPKTRSSIRVIKLCPSAVRVLKEQSVFSTPAVHDRKIVNSYVFRSSNGGFMSGAYLNNYFRKITREAGMPGFHIHDLRHANASLLINNGVPIKLVSDHLGHSTASITEEFYTHLFDDSLRITADVIEKIMAK